MIFLWWAAGAAVLLAAFLAAILCAGFCLQISADPARGCGAATLTVMGVLAARVKLFESDGRLYYAFNGGRLRPLKIKKKGDKNEENGKKGEKEPQKTRGAHKRLKVRSLSVNAAAGVGPAAVTAAGCVLASNALKAAIERYVDAREMKIAVEPDFGSENVKINLRVVAGWGVVVRAMFMLLGSRTKRGEKLGKGEKRYA